ATRVDVDGEHLLTSALEHASEQPPDEAVPHDQNTPRRDPLGPSQDASERLDHRPAPAGPVLGELDPALCARALREAARTDRRLCELRAGRLVTREAPFARAARRVMHERDAAAVAERRDHLVAQDDSGVRTVELLDVRAAEPAGDHPNDRAWPVRGGPLPEARL